MCPLGMAISGCYLVIARNVAISVVNLPVIARDEAISIVWVRKTEKREIAALRSPPCHREGRGDLGFPKSAKG